MRLREAKKWHVNRQDAVTAFAEEETDGAERERPFTSSRKSGEIVALLLSLLLSMAALTGVHWWSAANAAAANMKLLWLASWLPSGLRIGPYAGKELTALLVWLVSWGLLHLLLKRWEARLQPWIYGFTVIVFILLVLLWPPIYHYIFGWPA